MEELKENKNEINTKIQNIIEIFLGKIELLKVNRWIFDNQKLEEWWFNEKFHSELEKNNNWIRCYIFYIKINWENKKILFSYDDNLKINWFDYIYSPNDFKKLTPENQKKLWKLLEEIQQLEKLNRNEKWVEYTDTDEKIHEILNK